MLIALLALVLAVPAAAQISGDAAAEVSADYALAGDYWRGQLKRGSTAEVPCRRVRARWASWRGEQAAVALPCLILLNPEPWSRLSPASRRMVVFHEYGHLIGLGHGTDPDGMMYGGASGETWIGYR